MAENILSEPLSARMPRSFQFPGAGFMLPATAIAGALALLLVHLAVGGDRSISDGALMMLSLAAYLTAAVFYLTDLYAPFRLASRLGTAAAWVGVTLNLASWLTRWAAGYERELAIFLSQGRTAEDMPWIFRYIPFANLYDMSLAFAFGAGITTLIIMDRRQYRIIAALSLPLTAIILVLARFIGDELMDLPPVLDSYWRPIHVGVASLSYGVALVCFAVAVLYLLKDGVRAERMAVWAGIFALSVFATIGRFGIFWPSTFGTYSASTFAGESRMSLALRADIPYVGWLIAGSALLIIIAAVMFASDKTRLRRVGRSVWALGLLLQAGAIGTLVYQLRTISEVLPLVSTDQYERFAVWMLQQQSVPQAEIGRISADQLYLISSQWVAENGSRLRLSLNANPVELSALITAFAGCFFVLLFMVRPEALRRALPSRETLDALMYKLAGVAFAGLALLLMTGAVWANESWGRYWGWDAKEVGALVAWLTYAGFLHSRIAYGWRGRHSAYFAIVAFLFVIFTYLGVSYLLPGLHSYA